MKQFFKKLAEKIENSYLGREFLGPIKKDFEKEELNVLLEESLYSDLVRKCDGSYEKLKVLFLNEDGRLCPDRLRHLMATKRIEYVHNLYIEAAKEVDYHTGPELGESFFLAIDELSDLLDIDIKGLYKKVENFLDKKVA